MSSRAAKQRGDPVLDCIALFAMTAFCTLPGGHNSDKFFQ